MSTSVLFLSLVCVQTTTKGYRTRGALPLINSLDSKAFNSNYTFRIGTEKALGARRRDIRFQFLAEALVITALGGVLGILLSYAVSYSVGRLTLYSALAKHAEAGDIRLIVAPKILGIATAILAVVGVISGMFPAMRAANLDPIEDLRYE